MARRRVKPARRARSAGARRRVPAANEIQLQRAHPGAARHARWITALAGEFLQELALEGRELSLSLVGDRAIRRLNRGWRGKDKPTDVLSFPAGAHLPGVPGPVPLGDVVISLDTAARAAREHGRALREELARYLAHGVLHLLGHDHHQPAEARRMAAMEARLLGGRGMVADAARSRRGLTGGRPGREARRI